MNWYNGSIPEAITEAKNSNKVFLVYVEGGDDLSRSMTATYNDPVVSEKLNPSKCVALKLAAQSRLYEQFSEIYPVVVIPSSFFIGRNGMPIEIVTGSLVPSEFLCKIEKIFELHKEQSSKASGNSVCPDDAKITSASQQPMPSCSTSGSGSSQLPLLPDNELCNSLEDCSAPGSSQTLEEKVKRAQMLIAEKRAQKELEEKEKEKLSEQERRKSGKALQMAHQARHEAEMKAWVESRAKEKEEERIAKERVRAQIAQDRAERAAKYQQSKAEQQAIQREQENARLREEQERSARDAAQRSYIARLQFRLPDGSSVTHQFPADSTLNDAREFVLNEIQPSFTNFSLCTTFPRRQFTQNDLAQSLRDLQLAPSATLLILPARAVANVASDGSGFLSYIFWALLAPLLIVWRVITSWLGGNSNRSGSSGSAQPGNNGSQSSSSSSRNPNSRSESGAEGQTAQNSYQRDGNVFRLRNQSNDEDENNTWNGNSTQQM